MRKRLYSIITLSLLVISVISVMNVSNVKSIASGVDEFKKYAWEVTESNNDIVVLVTDLESMGMFAGILTALNYTDDLLNQLVNSKLYISVGKIYEVDGLMYIVPTFILGKNLTISKEFLMAMGLNESAAQAFEFTIPAGSGVVSLTNLIIPIDYPSVPSLTTFALKSIKNDFDLSDFRAMQYDSLMLESVAIPYAFENATPPAPILAPSNIPGYGSDWEATPNVPDGITLDYSTSGDDAIFSASGSNSTIDSDTNYYNEFSITINKFRMVYSLSTGLMKEISIDLNLVLNSTMQNPMTGDVQMQYISASIKFKIVYRGESDITIGLVDGEKLGFKISEFYMSSDLIDFINTTIAGGTISEANVTRLIAFMENMRWTYTYRATNPYYPSGLDLYYDVFMENPLIDWSNTTWDINNIYQLGAPYVTPDWEIQYGVFQFQQHMILKVFPKIFKYLMENPNSNRYFDYTSSYGIYESPDNNWVSMKSNFSTTFGYHQTLPNKGENKSEITITIGSWITYSKDGRLTEIGFEISFSAKVDENGNNDLTDDKVYSGTFRVVINRVENTAGPTSSPDFTQPINPPEPQQDWNEVTPYKIVGKGGGGFIPEKIFGVPSIYVIGGAIGLLFIIGLAAIFRRK